MANYKVTLGQRLRYHFDNIIMAGTGSLIVVLFFVFLTTAFITSLILYFLHVKDEAGVEMSFVEAYWSSLMHVIDQGTLTGDTDWQLRLATLVTTFVGIFLVSSLVSILNTGFTVKLEELKKGRSLVLEENHTVILGWSDKVFSIISELKIANENQRNSCVVILADENVSTMKDDLKQRLGNTGKLKVIFRHGNPRDPNEIMVANLNSAKSIIIMQPNEAKSDAYVIKTIMAIVNNPKRKEGKYNIIAEIKEEANRSIAKLIGKDEVTVVVSNDIISKITVQTSRQAGLSIIYNDLIDFDGVEIYILPVKNLAGHTFQEALFGFEDVLAIGIRTHEGKIMLNPPLQTTFGDQDKLIVIAEDDIELEYKTKTLPYSIGSVDRNILHKNTASKGVQKTLILGWNRNVKIIVKELDNYVLQGSEVTIVAEGDRLEEQVQELDLKTPNQKVVYKKGDINDRALLDELHLEYYDYIIIISYSDIYGTQEADAISLITLMYVRDIAQKMGRRFKIVSEMLDIKNMQLANMSKSDDFIISEQIISLVLAQLSENKELSAIFEDLFDADGLEIYLKPAENYTKIGQPTDFYSIIDVASQKNEIALGYRLMRNISLAPRYGVVLNPYKPEKVTFEEEDLIIVLAEE